MISNSWSASATQSSKLMSGRFLYILMCFGQVSSSPPMMIRPFSLTLPVNLKKKWKRDEFHKKTLVSTKRSYGILKSSSSSQSLSTNCKTQSPPSLFSITSTAHSLPFPCPCVLPKAWTPSFPSLLLPHWDTRVFPGQSSKRGCTARPDLRNRLGSCGHCTHGHSDAVASSSWVLWAREMSFGKKSPATFSCQHFSRANEFAVLPGGRTLCVGCCDSKQKLFFYQTQNQNLMRFG